MEQKYASWQWDIVHTAWLSCAQREALEELH
jgi:hypothetical protein